MFALQKDPCISLLCCVVQSCVLLSEQFNPVGLDMLFHVEPLDEPPVTVGALVWLLPSVDLPVPVETAGVGQQLTALLALHCSLPIGSDHVCPGDKTVLQSCSFYLWEDLLDSTGWMFLSLDLVEQVARLPAKPAVPARHLAGQAG